MKYLRWTCGLLFLIALAAAVSFSLDDQPVNKTKVAPGAKVYVVSMANNFDTFLKSALAKKKVPVQVVESRDAADYEITGTADSQKASTAKKLLWGDWRSTEEASLRMTDLKSSEVVWSYSVHQTSSNHGKQSAAESCAKHLKEAIEAK